MPKKDSKKPISSSNKKKDVAFDKGEKGPTASDGAEHKTDVTERSAKKKDTVLQKDKKEQSATKKAREDSLKKQTSKKDFTLDKGEKAHGTSSKVERANSSTRKNKQKIDLEKNKKPRSASKTSTHKNSTTLSEKATKIKDSVSDNDDKVRNTSKKVKRDNDDTEKARIPKNDKKVVSATKAEHETDASENATKEVDDLRKNKQANDTSRKEEHKKTNSKNIKKRSGSKSKSTKIDDSSKNGAREGKTKHATSKGTEKRKDRTSKVREKKPDAPEDAPAEKTSNEPPVPLPPTETPQSITTDDEKKPAEIPYTVALGARDSTAVTNVEKSGLSPSEPKPVVEEKAKENRKSAVEEYSELSATDTYTEETFSLVPTIIAEPLEKIGNVISDAVKAVIPDAVKAIPTAVAQKIDDVIGTMRLAVTNLQSITVAAVQSAADLQAERDTQLLELYARTADYAAAAQRANAIVWQHGLAADVPAALAALSSAARGGGDARGELLAVDCASIVADLRRKVAAYEREMSALKTDSLDVAVARHAQAAINQELQDVRLKKASGAIREENRFRKALALQTSKLSGLKEQIATAKRVTREMKQAHLAIADEQFDFGNELLKIREEARILAIEDRDAHARHIYKTFQELLDESKNLKLTKGNERDELESLIRAFRQLEDLSTYQHEKMHEAYFQPFSERLQQTQASYRDLLMNEEFRTIGKLPDELFADITHVARYNILEVEHQIRLEEESHETLFKALRTTLDSLADEHIQQQNKT